VDAIEIVYQDDSQELRQMLDIFRRLNWWQFKALFNAQAVGLHSEKDARRPGYTERGVLDKLAQMGLLMKDESVSFEAYRLTPAGKKLMGIETAT
jgi:hypothetical protein